MPRKTKDAEIKEETTKKSTTKLNSTTKKSKGSSSTASKKTSTSKKSPLKETKRTTTSKSTAKKVVTKKATSRKSNTTKVAAKKTTTRKTTTKKATTPKAKKATKKDILEYYDLPYRYNETVVKILAQTPKKLFIYWDISDQDRQNYIDRFGNDFFNNTVPVLIIHNDTENTSFEIEINDFANCWYLDINDTNCKYNIELGRRSKIKSPYIHDNYLYIASSNKIESPNDHILFETLSNTIYFRNVKTNTTYSKNMANLAFIKYLSKTYSIYDTYKKLYSNLYGTEDIIDFDVNNPSSTFM